MKTLFENFKGTSKAAWLELLEKELKGESLNVLQKIDSVEEIAYPSYFHREDAVTSASDPGQFPFTRGYEATSNNWNITTIFRLTTESDTNKAILAALMQGTEHVFIQLETNSMVRFEELLADVDLAYCWVTLEAQSIEQCELFLKYTKGINSRISFKNQLELLSLIPLTDASTHLFTINGYSVQQAGGTTWQEIAVVLGEGHDLLVHLIDNGIDAKQAAKLIQFHLGIGSHYFFEVAKIRALRELWSAIISQYIEGSPQTTTILARTGFVNISLKDPYTNLLRQTTEALSAAVGGVTDLMVQPYDWYSSNDEISFTRRMATNISLLLKEESYVHLVLDPAGGSYALENLTEAIAERAWAEFQLIERQGGISNSNVRLQLTEAISAKAKQRANLLNDKSIKRIGINIFPNPEQVNSTWKVLPNAWNELPTLNLEQSYEQA